MASHYRELIVWDRAMRLAQIAYSLADVLPRAERFGLGQQIRRCAVSVPSNIAEGHERRSRADYRRFLLIACGSLAELETHVEPASRLHPIDTSTLDRFNGEAVGRMLRAIERKLRIPVERQSTDSGSATALSPQP